MNKLFSRIDWRCVTLVAVFALLAAGITQADEDKGPDAASRAEIHYLIGQMRDSECRFNRNGIWYKPERAAEHIETKYRKLLEMGMVDSTEQFIARAASESSMSGKPYRVRCGEAKPVRSSAWFEAQLEEYRASHPAPTTQQTG